MTTTTPAPAGALRSRRASRPPRHPRRRVLVVVAVLLVVVLAGAWLLVGSRSWVRADGTSSWSPGLVQEVGSVTGLGTGVVWLVDDEQGWVLVGVRNAGPLPVTLAVQPLDHAAATASLEAGGAAAPRLTLGPGERADVRVALDVTCATYGDGVGESIDEVRLRTTTLGVTRTQVLALEPQPGVLGPHEPDASCAAAG
ncbi:hypothetical protein [Cellulomonas massiliensis]|uniref:hypothetical protein n=1 Tax=Cellulomonas massiliensis TaxID=1465811 RepID=UPI00031DB2DD|nr:hypothetical protein [Cellulomonas massiliensis]